MSTKDDFPLDESNLSTEETKVYKRMKSERDNADADVDDYDLLDNIIHRDKGYSLGQTENIIRDLINERAGQRSKKDHKDNYDRAMKGSV